MSSDSAFGNSNRISSVDEPSVDTAQEDSNSLATSGNSSSLGQSEDQSHVTEVGGLLYPRYNPEVPEMEVLAIKSTLVEIMDYVEDVVEVSNRDFKETWKTKHHDPLVSAIEKFETTLSELAPGCNWMYRLHNNFSIIAHKTTGGEVYAVSRTPQTALKLWNARNAYIELALLAQRYCTNQEMTQQYRVACMMKQCCCRNMCDIAKRRLLRMAHDVAPGTITGEEPSPLILRWSGPSPQTFLPPDVSPAIHDVPDLQIDNDSDDDGNDTTSVDS